MAISKICVGPDGRHFYSGLSSDTKPVYTTVPLHSKMWVSDTDEVFYVSTTGWAKHQEDYKRGAGERNEDSTTGTDHIAVANEGAVKTVIYTDGDTTIYNGPALLFGFRVTTALSAHAWTIDDSATARVNIPASSAAGIYTLPAATIFETTLVCNVGTSASAGVVEFYFRPLDTRVTWAY